MRVVHRQRAAPRAVGEDGDSCLVGQLAQRRAGVVPVDLCSGDDQWPFGGAQQLEHGLHGVDRRGDRVDSHSLRHPFRRIDGVEQHIERKFNKYRAGPAAQRVAVGLGHSFGDVLGALDSEGGLGEGPEHLDLRHLLQRAHALCFQRRGPAQQDHWAARLVGVGHSGNGVSDTWPGGDESHAYIARQSRVGVGGMGGGLLMPEVDDGDVVVQAAVVDRRDVAAAEGVDGADALGRQRAGDEFAAVSVGHISFLPERYRLDQLT